MRTFVKKRIDVFVHARQTILKKNVAKGEKISILKF